MNITFSETRVVTTAEDAQRVRRIHLPNLNKIDWSDELRNDDAFTKYYLLGYR